MLQAFKAYIFRSTPPPGRLVQLWTAQHQNMQLDLTCPATRKPGLQTCDECAFWHHVEMNGGMLEIQSERKVQCEVQISQKSKKLSWKTLSWPQFPAHRDKSPNVQNVGKNKFKFKWRLWPQRSSTVMSLCVCSCDMTLAMAHRHAGPVVTFQRQKCISTFFLC